jgi:hypothetical protein
MNTIRGVGLHAVVASLAKKIFRWVGFPHAPPSFAACVGLVITLV